MKMGEFAAELGKAKGRADVDRLFSLHVGFDKHLRSVFVPAGIADFETDRVLVFDRLPYELGTDDEVDCLIVDMESRRFERKTGKQGFLYMSEVCDKMIDAGLFESERRGQWDVSCF